MDDFGFENQNNDTNNNTENKFENHDDLRTSSFYTESCKKPAKKRSSLLQLIIVALISSVLGGAVVASLFVFVAPVVQPSVKGYFDSFLPGKTTVNKAVANSNDPTQYKKVEIISSADSPVTAIAESVGPSVVGIRTSFRSSDIFFGNQSQSGEGSGIIIRSDGYIMTNDHVINEAINPRTKKLEAGAKIEVFLPSQSNKSYTASVVGYDTKTDLAILKINATNLPAATFGDSEKLKVGELAVAIGNPGGMELAGSVTAGVISGLNRTIPTDDGTTLKLIQTDAAINPGNSGGALVNSKGEVIGINRLKIAEQGFEGLGFAIPSNLAKQVADNLIDHGYVSGRPLLGISVDPRYTEDVAKANNMPSGVYVADVQLMSGAQKAGIQAGDIITKIDGKAVKSKDELDNVKNAHKVGDKVPIEIYRRDENSNTGKTFTLQVELIEDKNN